MLRNELINDEQLLAQVQLALDEDIQSGDVTASLIPADKEVIADLFCRETAVLCGKDWLTETFKQLDEEIKVHWQANDTDEIKPDQIVCTISGSARTILSGERTAINFLQTLSGTATTTRNYVDVIKGSNANILDTRKTIPGLRLAQKYAVSCGGGINHRIGLYDMILIKENHIEAAGSIEAALNTALQKNLPVEIEVETLKELQQALEAGAQRILLDNMSTDTLTLAVTINQQFSEDNQVDAAKLEASGNVSLETIKAIAKTGVDYISVGGLTKHLNAVDFSLRFRE
ncbi:Quinolinate phosphoribosyltransferase [decarboxylating] [hydrothermal vent metagenome]|uniref:Probable nicotinate-nucleotide pyrophosphorylase [carboxylating] n=1 Tax=hydrothermal vent metagenome TaxID=652676 RepID=A0A3B1ADP0_9ZZZZ